jgi:hypothetical protein
MEFVVAEGAIYVRLSERNLRTLLNKLQRPMSLKTLVRDSRGQRLIITAESDEVHYQDREPGPMHPDDLR